MFQEFQSQKDHHKSILSLLIEVAKSDNEVVGNENKFLAEVAARKGLSVEDANDVIRNPEKYQFVPPTEEKDRMEIFYYVLFLMRMDGVIAETEERIVYKIGLKLGFNEQLSEDLIGVMKTYLNENVPPEAMLEKIRKYLN